MLFDADVAGVTKSDPERGPRSPRANDGTIGTVAGLGCAACRHIEPIPGAPYIVDRHRVVLIPRG
jgi:hypothetical protein